MKVTSFGEVLWDDFPDGKRLGGAPLNLVSRLRSFGADAAIISRVGDDEDGKELVRQVAAKQVATDWIQTDTEQATSLVKVILSASGSASYEIVYPCAWDKIVADDAARQRVAESDAFLFGSLATRDAVSHATLLDLLNHAKFRVFDVNLRPPYYDVALIEVLMAKADLVKVNDDELYELADALGSPYHSLEQNIVFLADKIAGKRLCVTLGEHGAVFYNDGKFCFHGGYRIQVADTVGSGDSFLAAFVYHYLSGAEPKRVLDFACALGAMVAERHGANPEISEAEILRFINPI